MPNLKRVPKKTALITTAVAAGLVVGGLGVTRSEAAMDWLGLKQKLDYIDEKNDNQDDRITNNESDVKKLRQDTNTGESDDKVTVREVVTENTDVSNNPEPPAVPPITVTKWEIVPNGGEFNCKYTYSDGTMKTFRWKWFGTVVTREGQTLESAYTNGVCNNAAIGQKKD